MKEQFDKTSNKITTIGSSVGIFAALSHAINPEMLETFGEWIKIGSEHGWESVIVAFLVGLFIRTPQEARKKRSDRLAAYDPNRPIYNQLIKTVKKVRRGRGDSMSIMDAMMQIDVEKDLPDLDPHTSEAYKRRSEYV